MVDAASGVADIGKPDRICMDCGKLFLLCHAGIEDDITICPRCSSPKHDKYVEAEHEDIVIEVPEGYEHPLEKEARRLFNEVTELTGWRESKVKLWFQLQNPLLGNVSPEWMLLNLGQDGADRLDKFIKEAKEASTEYRGDDG